MVDNKKSRLRALGLLEKTYLILLLVIFGGIVLHAPLSVGLGSLLPAYDLLIKSWKEIMLGVAAVLALVILSRRRQYGILKEPLILTSLGYGLLHVTILPFFQLGALQSIAGLLIDLRYVVFFVLVYIAARLFPVFRPLFLRVGLIGAFIVLLFGFLQVFILPPDVLKYIGYTINTIVPHLTVDQNPDYIRINSTLRGPNPLGAYAVIVLSAVVAWWLVNRRRLSRRTQLILGILLLAGVVVLWASYSRSALIAAVVALAVVVAVSLRHRISRRTWIVSSVIGLALIGGIIAARDTSIVSNVIFHEDPSESNQVNSNDGHLESLKDGAYRMATQPFGAGIGSSGSASLLGDDPLILENQYFFIAHETGWLGLMIFLLIFIGILTRLWTRRADWLALALLASGIGLAIIGLLLPVWVDDTVSLVWWGLAGLAIGSNRGERRVK